MQEYPEKRIRAIMKCPLCLCSLFVCAPLIYAQQTMNNIMQDDAVQCISTITQDAPRNEHILMQYESACAQEDNRIAL